MMQEDSGFSALSEITCVQDVKASGAKDVPAVEVVPLPAADEEGESTTIYVKNLAFATTDAGLQVCYKV